MEGDVLPMAGVTWQMLVTGVAAVLGGVFGLLKWFAMRLLQDIEVRIARIDDLAKEVARVDDDLKRLAAEAATYQRREDAAREAAAADDRYQRTVERLISTLRDDLGDAKRRVAELEKSREDAIVRYQLRDDAIREYTAMNAKLDRLYEVMMEMKNDR